MANKIDPIRREVKAMMHHLNGMLDSLDDSVIPDDEAREQVYATVRDRFQEANRIENALALLAQDAAVRLAGPNPFRAAAWSSSVPKETS